MVRIVVLAVVCVLVGYILGIVRVSRKVSNELEMLKRMMDE